MLHVSFEARSLKGDRVIKTFANQEELLDWVERRESQTQYVPMKVVKKVTEEIEIQVL